MQAVKSELSNLKNELLLYQEKHCFMASELAKDKVEIDSKIDDFKLIASERLQQLVESLRKGAEPHSQGASVGHAVSDQLLPNAIVRESLDQINQMKQLCLVAAYFRCYRQFLVLSRGSLDLLTEGSFRAASNMFRLMASEYIELYRASKCRNMVNFAEGLCKDTRQCISESLQIRVMCLTDKLHFPFTSKADRETARSALLTGDQSDALAEELNSILRDVNHFFPICELFGKPGLPSDQERLRSFRVPVSLYKCAYWDSSAELASLFARPIRIGFNFHFYENASTTRIDKPEWYLQQLVIWYRESIGFLEEFVFNQCKEPAETKRQFALALASMACARVNLNVIAINSAELSSEVSDKLLCHVVDEYCSFLSQMSDQPEPSHNSAAGHISIHSCEVDSLNDEPIFRRLVDLQRKRISDFSNELIDELHSACLCWLKDTDLPNCNKEMSTFFLSMIGRLDLFYRPSCEVRWYLLLGEAAKALINVANTLIDKQTSKLDVDNCFAHYLCAISSLSNLRFLVYLNITNTVLGICLEYKKDKMKELIYEHIGETDLWSGEAAAFYAYADMHKNMVFMTTETVLSGTRPMFLLMDIDRHIQDALEQLVHIVMNWVSSHASDLAVSVTSPPFGKNTSGNIDGGHSTRMRPSLWQMCNEQLSRDLGPIVAKLQALDTEFPLMESNITNPLIKSFELMFSSALDNVLFEEVIAMTGLHKWSRQSAACLYNELINNWKSIDVPPSGLERPKELTNLKLSLDRSTGCLRLLCLSNDAAIYVRDELLRSSSNTDIPNQLDEFNLGKWTRNEVLFMLTLREDSK